MGRQADHCTVCCGVCVIGCVRVCVCVCTYACVQDVSVYLACMWQRSVRSINGLCVPSDGHVLSTRHSHRNIHNRKRTDSKTLTHITRHSIASKQSAASVRFRWAHDVVDERGALQQTVHERLCVQRNVFAVGPKRGGGTEGKRGLGSDMRRRAADRTMERERSRERQEREKCHSQHV